MAMSKTNRYNTPGGNPDKLVNPLSSEIGPTDSGEDQLLLLLNRRSSKTLRTPPKISPRVTPSKTPTQKSNEIEVINEKGTIYEKSETKDQQCSTKNNEIHQVESENYFDKWQIEILARKQLEALVESLQQQVKRLEEKVSLLDKKSVKDNISSQKSSVVKSPQKTANEFHTDEEELLLETEGNRNKRKSKKRKAESSPEAVIKCQQTGSKSDTATIMRASNKEIRDLPQNKSHVKGTRQTAPPPIMISGLAMFGELKSIVEKCTNKACKYTSYNKDNWKVIVEDADAYRSVTEELNKKKIQWHSYENKATRSIKVVARGLHSSCVAKEIVEDLIQKGFQALDANNLIKNEIVKDSTGVSTTKKRSLPLFMLTFENKESLDKIYSIKSIMGIVVKIEPLRKSKTVPQCKRCQAFGHTQKYCNREFACVKCEGRHATKNCPMGREQKAKCVNCQGNHPASYRGCPVAKKFQDTKRKNKTGNKLRNSTNTKPVVESKKVTVDNITKNQPGKAIALSKSDENKSYSQIIKNVRKNEETSIKEMLELILKRIDQQDLNIKQLSEEVALKKQ